MAYTTKIGIIGGTGFSEFQQGEKTQICDTPFGRAAAAAVVSSVGAHGVAFLARHGNPHVFVPHMINYRANMWLLKQLGVETVFAINAVGGIRTGLSVGSLVIPDQLIDYTYGRHHTYYDTDGNNSLEKGGEHCDFTYPFTESLRIQLFNAAQRCQLSVTQQAVYAVTQGPRLETAAEINRLESDGCDIVGMTLMPEAVLARELGMNYVSVCVVVNPAAGRSEKLITLDDINVVLNNTMQSVRQLLIEAITSL